MKRFDLSRYALSLSAAALLAACGGSEPPIGAPGAMAQSRAIAQHDARGGSWMLPEAKNETLLYVSIPSAAYGEVLVLSYPKGKLVGTLTKDLDTPEGECVDKAGDVFVVNAKSGNGAQIVEYKHGATKPSAILQDGYGGSYYYLPLGCAIDPSTGNLAVTNNTYSSEYFAGNIAIWQNASGSPQYYYDPHVQFPTWCTYDDKGDLFVDGSDSETSTSYTYSKLPRGSSKFRAIRLNQSVYPGGLQWRRDHLLIGDAATTIYEFKIKGARGTETSSVTLNQANEDYQFVVRGKLIVAANYLGHNVLFWKWPAGGDPTKTITEGQDPLGVTISVAPSR